MKKQQYNTKSYSTKQEQYVAKQLGGNVVAGSGAPKFCRGDVIIPGTIVIECKTTIQEDKKSWTIKREWLEQNEKERLDLMLPYSALAISLDPSGTNNLYVINETLMKKLIEVIR